MTLRRMIRSIVARMLMLYPSPLTGISTLMYHSISDTDPGFLTDTPAAFERQIRFIKERGLRAVFASEIPELIACGDIADTVCITLDDGYEDNYTNAFPILKRYGIKATVFLITGLLGKTYTDSRGTARTILTEEQVREMARSGVVEFMPHSHTHPELDHRKGDALEAEVGTSKREVERLTGKEASVFAYPKGKYNGETVEALKRAGFRAAFTVRPGIIRADADVFRLPRNPLGEISDAELSMKLSDRLDTYLALKRRA